MTYYVYILACFKAKTFSCYYTGQTDNLNRRIHEHYKAVKLHITDKFTGRFDFVKLMWYRRVPTRDDALRLESFLKSLTPPQKRAYMTKQRRR
jgi:predicted GIY-YIG superfamily endonuclease